VSIACDHENLNGGGETSAVRKVLRKKDNKYSI
jgi:hypothetical protein